MTKNRPGNKNGQEVEEPRSDELGTAEHGDLASGDLEACRPGEAVEEMGQPSSGVNPTEKVTTQEEITCRVTEEMATPTEVTNLQVLEELLEKLSMVTWHRRLQVMRGRG